MKDLLNGRAGERNGFDAVFRSASLRTFFDLVLAHLPREGIPVNAERFCGPGERSIAIAQDPGDEALLELVDGDVHCAWHMTGRELLGRAHVEAVAAATVKARGTGESRLTVCSAVAAPPAYGELPALPASA